MADKAVFLDRDGTIIEEAHYLDATDRIKFIPGAAAAIKRLNKAGFKVFIVTNQSGVARGYFPETFVAEAHTFISDALQHEGAFIDAYYYCPHHPQGTVREYTKKCICRKPGIGMLQQAASQFDLDLPASYMVGDHGSDVGMGKNGELQAIFLRTGHGLEEWEKRAHWEGQPDYVAESIVDAVAWIVQDSDQK